MSKESVDRDLTLNSRKAIEAFADIISAEPEPIIVDRSQTSPERIRKGRIMLNVRKEQEIGLEDQIFYLTQCIPKEQEKAIRDMLLNHLLNCDCLGDDVKDRIKKVVGEK